MRARVNNAHLNKIAWSHSSGLGSCRITVTILKHRIDRSNKYTTVRVHRWKLPFLQVQVTSDGGKKRNISASCQFSPIELCTKVHQDAGSHFDRIFPISPQVHSWCHQWTRTRKGRPLVRQQPMSPGCLPPIHSARTGGSNKWYAH